MNRPGFKTYLIGNPVSCLAILVACGFVLYQWWTHQDTTPWPLPVGAVFAAMWALDASNRLAEYRRWKRMWDAVAGDTPPQQRYPRGLEPWRFMLLFAIGAGCGLVLWDRNLSSAETRQWVAVAFAISVLIFVVGGIRWARILLGDGRKASEECSYGGKEHVVAHCLPAAKRSMKPLEALEYVPEYCRGIIEASRHRSHGS